MTTIRTTMGLGIALALGLLTGCTETIDSKNLRTAGIAALIEADATSEKALTVIATLKTGGAQSNTYVDLSGGDSIFASAAGKRVEMTAQSTGVYEAEFDTAVADTEIVVDLQRDGDDPAPNSKGTLPAPFSFNIDQATASRAADLTFTWDNSGSKDDMTIELSGTCIFRELIDVPGDSGTHVIPAGKLTATNSMKPETCDVTVEMKRSRKGSPDTIYDSESTFVLAQTRTGKFTSTP